MSDAPQRIFDRERLAQFRTRHAPGAHEHDFLWRHAAADLADRLTLVRRSFPRVLNLGAAGPAFHHHLRDLPGTRQVVETDLTPAMLTAVGLSGLVADEEALPFRAGSLDLVVSALSLQLVNDLPGALVQIRRALRPDGLFLATLLGGQTLWELREALMLAEIELDGGASPRVAPFADVRALGALLQRAGFALPVADSDMLEVGYSNALALMHDIKAMGWANILVERRRRFLKRRVLMRTAEIYSERFSRPDGRVRATFEFVTLTGWAPDDSQPRALRPGSARTRLADALGVSERKAVDPSDGEDT